MFRLQIFIRAILALALLGSADAHNRGVQAQALTGSAPSALPGRAALKEFPLRPLYLDIIKREALSRGLPPAIADAVVRIESGYDPAAVGAVGEIGLMQVRPTTAAMLGFGGAAAELADPETNIRYGVAYLAKAWRLAGGDLCRALMKYRAGHGEETMSPLSAEYCRRARVHLAAIGWSPGDKTDSSSGSVTLSVRSANADPNKVKVEAGPKMISVSSSAVLLAANRARIAEVWNRISVAAKR